MGLRGCVYKSMTMARAAVLIVFECHLLVAALKRATSIDYRECLIFNSSLLLTPLRADKKVYQRCMVFDDEKMSLVARNCALNQYKSNIQLGVESGQERFLTPLRECFGYFYSYIGRNIITMNFLFNLIRSLCSMRAV